MKTYDKNIESSYLKYWDVNNSNGWAILQKCSVNGGFKWVEKIHKAIKFNQKAWLKSYIDTNTKLRKKN